MSVCRYCGAEIDWIRDQNSHNVPVDPEPVFVIETTDGERFLTDEGGELLGREAREDEVQTREQKMNAECGFVPHHRVCQALRSRR